MPVPYLPDGLSVSSSRLDSYRWRQQFLLDSPSSVAKDLSSSKMISELLADLQQLTIDLLICRAQLQGPTFASRLEQLTSSRSPKHSSGPQQ